MVDALAIGAVVTYIAAETGHDELQRALVAFDAIEPRRFHAALGIRVIEHSEVERGAVAPRLRLQTMFAGNTCKPRIEPGEGFVEVRGIGTGGRIEDGCLGFGGLFLPPVLRAGIDLAGL